MPGKERKGWKEKQRERQVKQKHTQEEYEKTRAEHEKNKPRKLPKGKILLGVILLTIAISAFGLLQFTGSQGNSKPEPNSDPDQAHNFSLKDINGTQISLSQYSGRPIVVHFMALQGCSGSLGPVNYDRLPLLRSIFNEYSDRVGIITVSVATCAGCDTILSNLRIENGIYWTLGNDYDDQVLDIVEAYSDYELYDGTLIIIDKSLKVAQVYNDQITTDTLSSKIDQLL